MDHGGQEHDLIDRLLGDPATDLSGDARIGVDGEVGAVVLERSGWDQADAILLDRAADLGPRESFVQERTGPGHRASSSSFRVTSNGRLTARR